LLSRKNMKKYVGCSYKESDLIRKLLKHYEYICKESYSRKIYLFLNYGDMIDFILNHMSNSFVILKHTDMVRRYKIRRNESNAGIKNRRRV